MNTMALRVFAVLAIVTISASATQVPPPAPLAPSGQGRLGSGGIGVTDASVLSDPIWDDGLAEVSHYNLVQFRYGHLHHDGQATMITVREFCDAQRVVKSGEHHDGDIPILKNHLVKSFQTGVYRYEQASTVLARRTDGVPLRLFIASHEWCGSAGKSWVNEGRESVLRVMSYFDGHGDFEQPLELPRDGVLEDGLWLWLRAMDFHALEQHPMEIHVIPTQLEARAQVTEAQAAKIVGQADRVTVPAGVFATENISVAIGTENVNHYWYDRASPHILVRYLGADGTTLELVTTSRTDYWNHHAPEDVPGSVK